MSESLSDGYIYQGHGFVGHVFILPIVFSNVRAGKMDVLSLCLTYINTHEFFQIELFLLLVSLILSLLFRTPFIYLCISGLCLLITTGPTAFELFGSHVGHWAYAEATTTVLFAVILIFTFAHALLKRLSAAEVRQHAAIALAFSAYLALQAFWIIQVTERPFDRDVRQLRTPKFITLIPPTDRSLQP